MRELANQPANQPTSLPASQPPSQGISADSRQQAATAHSKEKKTLAAGGRCRCSSPDAGVPIRVRHVGCARAEGLRLGQDGDGSRLARGRKKKERMGRAGSVCSWGLVS